MALKVIQITKINTGDFVFNNTEDLGLPVAPLVSTKFLPENPDILKIRATLYINSEENDVPTISEPIVDGSTLSVYFNSNFSLNTPATSNVWYVEVDYTSNPNDAPAGSIKNVVSYLVDTNSSSGKQLGGGLEDGPPTSRGTQTGVTK